MTYSEKLWGIALAALLSSVCGACSTTDSSPGSGSGADGGDAGGPRATGGAGGTGGASGASGAVGGATGGAGGAVTAGTGGQISADAGGGGTGNASDGGDAGGAAGTGGTDGGATAGTQIQDIQDGTLAIDDVATVTGVFVTAARQTPSLSFNFVIQEPVGKTTASHIYPEYAGVTAFIPESDSGAKDYPTIGDCVDVTGTISDFHGLTELANVTWKPASNCGTFPQPYAIPTTTVDFGDIATDTDIVAAGNQPGALAERFEGVLVRITNIQATAAPGPLGAFPVAQKTKLTGPVIYVDRFYVTEIPAAGQDYASITGIFSDFDRYLLQPRTLGDIIR